MHHLSKNEKVILVLVFSMSSFTTNSTETTSPEVVSSPSCAEFAVQMYEAYVDKGIDLDYAEVTAMDWLNSCEVTRYLLRIPF